MKLLLLSWNYPPVLGGIEIVAAKLAEGFGGRGDLVRVCTAHHPEAESTDIVRRAAGPGVPRFLLHAWREGGRLCREHGFDLIVCGSVVAAPAAWRLSRRHRLPYVVLAHGTELVKWGGPYRMAVRFLLRRAARLCANSRNTARILEELGIPGDRVDVVYPGVSPEEFRAPPNPAPEFPGRKVIVSVGRLIRRKGVLEFVERAMPAIAGACPEVLYLVIGDDAARSLAHRKEAMRARIEQAIDERGLGEQVRCLGRVGDARLRSLLHEARLFVLPGLDLPDDVEGFGIVFCEAALCGAPAVATRVGGMPEAVDDGVGGRLCEPGDYEGLASTISGLLRDERALGTLAASAARRAEEQFAWPVILDQYRAAFEQVVDPG